MTTGPKAVSGVWGGVGGYAWFGNVSIVVCSRLAATVNVACHTRG